MISEVFVMDVNREKSKHMTLIVQKPILKDENLLTFSKKIFEIPSGLKFWVF